MRDDTRLLILFLASGVVIGLCAGLLLCYMPTPAAIAQTYDVGPFFTSATGARTNCRQIASPVSGQTWCFEQSTGQIVVWTGLEWATVSVNNQAPILHLIGGQANQVNDYIRYSATVTGSNQHVGMFLDMVGTNTLANGFFRIPLALRVQTGGGTNADGLVGLNVVAQQNAADDVAFVSGLEFSFNNLKRNDPLNPTDENHFGLTLDAYGGFSTGPAALAIRTAAVNSQWQRGIFITASTISSNGYAFDYEGNGTSGPVRITNDAALQVASAVYFNATQVMFNGSASTSTPQCINNCGTSPTVAGHNTAMRVTMGATGTPRSPFTVLFNGRWNATPACMAQLDTATTTTVSVTNSTATGVTVHTVVGPSQGGVFSIHCFGVG